MLGAPLTARIRAVRGTPIAEATVARDLDGPTRGGVATLWLFSADEGGDRCVTGCPGA